MGGVHPAGRVVGLEALHPVPWPHVVPSYCQLPEQQTNVSPGQNHFLNCIDHCWHWSGSLFTFRQYHQTQIWDPPQAESAGQASMSIIFGSTS